MSLDLERINLKQINVKLIYFICIVVWSYKKDLDQENDIL